MSFTFIWNKENEVWHIISSFSKEKLQKLLSVNTETKRFKGVYMWMMLFRGAKFDGVRYAI